MALLYGFCRLNDFLDNSDQVGFFLDRQEFRESALASSNRPRPITPLLATVCLWGATFLRLEGHTIQESDFLSEA